MAIDDSLAYQAVALHIELGDGALDDDGYTAHLDALVDEVEDSGDVRALLIRLGSVAAVALEIACRATDRDPRRILREAARQHAADEVAGEPRD